MSAWTFFKCYFLQLAAVMRAQDNGFELCNDWRYLLHMKICYSAILVCTAPEKEFTISPDWASVVCDGDKVDVEAELQ